MAMIKIISKSVIKVVYIRELVKLECKDSYLVNSEQRIENSFYEYVVILWGKGCNRKDAMTQIFIGNRGKL
jgi:hypothetical protein